MKVIGLRYFNVFGKRQSKEYAGVIKLFLHNIQQKNLQKLMEMVYKLEILCI
uniref:Uncharacterized protein n=1 Tax=uncultured marine thaumarchaeote AD1000_44_B05 TaxID=1455917 RepID=A0A075FSC5_9ARCH|nr:hypothetical protein [uncultured marine thaumarchaeote AD1000_44_B05]